MTAIAVARSSLTTSLVRYSRSWGLWLLLVVALIGARFWVPRGDGTTLVIAIGGHLPVMTSAMLGVSLGIVVSTLLLPAGYIFLRSNTTRRQPWQVEEVTPASRVAIALGRFGADVAMLFAVLGVLTIAGWFLAWLLLPPADIRPGQIAFALWLVAAPAVMGLAAIRILFDAVPILRRGLGDLAYFVLYITSIAAPSSMADQRAGFAANMVDFAGFVRPLVFDAPSLDRGFQIGGGPVEPGRIPLDVMAGLLSPGYVESRAAWAAIAILVAALAGLIYRPHRAPKRAKGTGRLSRWLSAGAPPAADPQAPPARRSAVPALGLVAAEFRLIGNGRLFWLVAAGVAAVGWFADFRHAASPAALLLLTFGLTAQAGRAEARGLRPLAVTSAMSPWLRRGAFVVAGTLWSVLLAIPAIVAGPALDRLGLAAATGATAAATAMALAAVSGSAFAPRVVLLIAWYVYLSA